MKLELEINGVKYPCGQTMGAMLRFKEATGREIQQMDVNSFSDLCTYLHCCIASACAREKKPFDYTLMDFADNVGIEDIAKWREMLLANTEKVDEGGQKKRRKK